MRRILSLILISLGIFLMSCSSGSVYSVDMQYEEHNFYGECEVNGCVYTGRFYISEGNRLSERERYIILSSPEALSEVRIDIKEDGTEVSCDGVSAGMDAVGIARVFELFDIPASAVFRRDEDKMTAVYEGSTYEIVYEGGGIKKISSASGTDIMSLEIIERYE